MMNPSPYSSNGAYADLPKGKTWYQLAGPARGPAVVLIHGFSLPACVWDGTFEHLAGVGFRVLRYDLYGRGRSARPPDCSYGLDCYVEQLAALLDAIPLRGAVGVVGLSMGGPIAATFAARYPHRTRALALIGPVVSGVASSWRDRVLAIPHLGEWALRLWGRKILSESIADDFYRRERMPSSMPARYRALMDNGFFHALHMSVREGMLGDHTATFRQLDKALLPVLAIWGQEDRTVPPTQAQTLQGLIRHVSVKIIPEAGHMPHLEQPEQTHPLLSTFLAP